MTRECQSDFSLLQGYITEYRIAKNLNTPSYVKSLKRIHKQYFSIVTWHAEICHNEAEFLLQFPECTDKILEAISESVSDLGASFFNWINGSNKTARIMLRSAIENYVKAISATGDISQLKEKSLHKMFDNASKMEVITHNPLIRESYMQLHSDYKALCADVHTATIQNMEQLSSLAGLPAFNEVKAKRSEEIFIRTTKNISTIFCLKFNSFFHLMHHRNRENILTSLNRNVKPAISGIIDK